jgi:hypothetical protein
MIHHSDAVHMFRNPLRKKLFACAEIDRVALPG